jgi:hypothetical protein
MVVLSISCYCLLNVHAFLNRNSISHTDFCDSSLSTIIKVLKHSTKLTFLMWVNKPHFDHVYVPPASVGANVSFLFIVLYALCYRTQRVRLGQRYRPMLPVHVLELARAMEANPALHIMYGRARKRSVLDQLVVVH